MKFDEERLFVHAFFSDSGTGAEISNDRFNRNG